jgi:glyoxylase-like metal-dependent hydrolase (beta-lactamase superfamily II)
MKRSLRLGDFELFWLRGGRFSLDGGAMFGVVPKVLWKKKYPSDEDNAIPLICYPILIKTPDTLILMETGFGNKLNDKQRKIFKVSEEWQIIDDLSGIDVKREDIDFVIVTHFDFDHSGGIIMQHDDGRRELTFPKARHIIQRSEWEDVLNPNSRSINTYWPDNYELLRDSSNLNLIDGEKEIAQGIRVIHAGGHTKGFQVVEIESGDETAIHLGDLLPTHLHFNPLWIMAYDNFPLDTMKNKEVLERKYIERSAWFTFYHDPFVRACKFDEQGNVLEKVE